MTRFSVLALFGIALAGLAQGNPLKVQNSLDNTPVHTTESWGWDDCGRYISSMTFPIQLTLHPAIRTPGRCDSTPVHHSFAWPPKTWSRFDSKRCCSGHRRYRGTLPVFFCVCGYWLFLSPGRRICRCHRQTWSHQTSPEAIRCLRGGVSDLPHTPAFRLINYLLVDAMPRISIFAAPSRKAFTMSLLPLRCPGRFLAVRPFFLEQHVIFTDSAPFLQLSSESKSGVTLFTTIPWFASTWR